ncbi:hypothetical protein METBISCDRAFT_21722 [Metschnikowia bicuspidata]|uniref:Cullin family profile domain-containing protein n=1 Tax=Metschnikowia bicuspidata TaxID=27322 RepID=A0A4P9ZGU6_9ASCO|nr:hypothetical protein METBISCDRAFT_21722 [Metschnikowia bicuspidata]
MAPNVTLTPALVATLAPAQVLADLLAEPRDTENDLTFLLHWLLPHYLHPNTEYVAPLARTRAAARQCLREPAVQLKFVNLLVNSVAVELRKHLAPYVATAPLPDVLAHVAALSAYYNKQAAALNLCNVAADLFTRSNNALFVPYLLTSRVQNELRTHLAGASTDATALRALASMGMPPFLQTVVVAVTTDRIHQHIASTCARVWDRPSLPTLQKWMRLQVYPGFVAAVGDLAGTQDCSSSDLVQFAQDELISLRTSEIYDLVAAYARSHTALSELHLCLAAALPATRTLQRTRLVDTFIAQCHRRLLHLGSNTVKIILEYVNTIKAFLVVDPTGVLLDKVARSIRKYLKTRRDLVAHLAKGMLDSDARKNPLHEFSLVLGGAPAAPAVDDLSDINWVPDPIDALPDFKKGKVSDCVGALTSILPLPSVLMDEFTNVFGAQLLARKSVDEIVAHVEKLKARFGAGEFSTLDVMIRDVQESARINRTIGNGRVDMIILSRNYWPSLADDADAGALQVPVKDALDAYARSFASLKRGRHLKFLPTMGLVDVELHFDNCSRMFVVSPAQAVVVKLFSEDDDTISLLAVALLLGMSQYAASQAIDFWVKTGVLEDLGQRYGAVSVYTDPL